jgi:hypothetical protein
MQERAIYRGEKKRTRRLSRVSRMDKFQWIMTLMKIAERIWPILFSFACLLLVGESLAGRPIPAITVGLVALASAPWSIPWLAKQVESLKVASVLELNFPRIGKKDPAE